jgi:hypothetical protein
MAHNDQMTFFFASPCPLRHKTTFPAYVIYFSIARRVLTGWPLLESIASGTWTSLPRLNSLWVVHARSNTSVCIPREILKHAWWSGPNDLFRIFAQGDIRRWEQLLERSRIVCGLLQEPHEAFKAVSTIFDKTQLFWMQERDNLLYYTLKQSVPSLMTYLDAKCSYAYLTVPRLIFAKSHLLKILGDKCAQQDDYWFGVTNKKTDALRHEQLLQITLLGFLLV